MKAFSHLHLQDASRSSDTHTTLLSSPNPTEGEGRSSIPTVGHKLSAPPFRLEAGAPKRKYLVADEGVCTGACESVDKKTFGGVLPTRNTGTQRLPHGPEHETPEHGAQ